MPITNQGTCQSRKTAKNPAPQGSLADFPNQDLAGNPKHRLGTFAVSGASKRKGIWTRSKRMLGKLAGAWLGEKIVGRNSGAKGAILGYGAASLARRSVPTLAA